MCPRVLMSPVFSADIKETMNQDNGIFTSEKSLACWILSQSLTLWELFSIFIHKRHILSLRLLGGCKEVIASLFF